MAVGEEVGGDAHRRARREDVVPARAVLLEHVVLDGATELRAGHSLFLGHQLVEEQEQRGRGVDRHRRRDLAERDPFEEELHVGDRVDRDAGPPHLAGGTRVVGVVAELRRKVEGDREARLAALEEIAEPLVRLDRRPEAGVLPNRPRPAAVHVLVGPAGKGVFARRLEVDAFDVVLGVDGLELDFRVGLAVIFGRGHARESYVGPL